MEEQREKETALRHAMFMLPVAQYDTVAKIIMERCFISRQVLNNWIAGRTEVPPMAKREIENKINKKIWSDENKTEN